MLEIRKLGIRYGQKLLLKEISLQLEKGKVYTISGVSGVGKSSLLNKIGLIAKEEVGILKALGFSSAAVRRFYYKELTIYTSSVCVMSLVMSVVLVAALAVSLQLKQQDVLAVVMRNLLTLPLVAFV